ncbi:hypothetical protein [Campylobacter fetus]|nr:hypothetical protein [Campylobacter fetus]
MENLKSDIRYEHLDTSKYNSSLNFELKESQIKTKPTKVLLSTK